MGRQVADSEIIDYDEVYTTASALKDTSSLLNGTTTTIVTAFRVKPGKKAWLKFLGNGIQAGGSAFVTFKLLVNGTPFYPFDGSLNQWAPPESNYSLPVTLELPTSCTVGAVAINTDASNNYDATVRIKIVYTDFVIPEIYKSA